MYKCKFQINRQNYSNCYYWLGLFQSYKQKQSVHYLVHTQLYPHQTMESCKAISVTISRKSFPSTHQWSAPKILIGVSSHNKVQNPKHVIARGYTHQDSLSFFAVDQVNTQWLTLPLLSFTDQFKTAAQNPVPNQSLLWNRMHHVSTCFSKLVRLFAVNVFTTKQNKYI